MRRSPVLFTTGALTMVALGAMAADLLETSDAEWAAYTATNIDKGADLELAVVEVQDSSLLLYRGPWDDVSSRVELAKDDATSFSEYDRCLLMQTISATETISVNGTRYRAGLETYRLPPDDYEATIPAGAAITLPASLDTVSAVRFLTAGAKIAASSYDVTFTYGDATPAATVTVPVAVDTLTGTRGASGTNYTTAEIVELTYTADAGIDADAANGSDCAGDGGDEVVVTNPNPTAKVVSVTFDYPDYLDATAATGWLGGPLAVSFDTVEADLDATFLYRGDIVSSTGANALDAGNDALWYEVAWSPSVTNGAVVLTFDCSDDSSFVGWPTGAETVDLSLETSPYALTVCDGRYIRYQLDFTAEFDVSPVVSSITFTNDPDLDNDGYGGDGAATDLDCDDNDASRSPGAFEIIGDGIDGDCDGAETCYLDTDNDGERDSDGLTVPSADADCNDAGETTAAAGPVDCSPNDGTVYSTATDLPGDGIDQNCDGVEDCFQDLDGDGHGTATVKIGNDADCIDVGESTTSGDCNDANSASFPGAIVLGSHVGDGVDRDCDGFEECYADNDKDGYGTTVVIDDDGDGLCQTADSEAAIGGDCNDTNAGIHPGIAEITADDIDQDCDGSDDCYEDLDADGFGTTNLVQSAGATCAGVSEAKVSTDCDDADASTNPSAFEVIGNNKDNNCNLQEICYDDADDDNARSDLNTRISSIDHDCLDAFEGQSSDPVDCDDTDATQFPGNTEATGDGKDNNCDGIEVCYADADNDDYRHLSSTVNSTLDEDCTDAGEALAAQGIDCNDAVFTTNPGAPDLCGDGVDNNCDNLGNNLGNAGVVGGWLDDDADTLDFAEEVALGTSDCDVDSDDDGLSDNDEVLLGTNPVLFDTDADGVSDGLEVGSPLAPLNTDGDALIDALDTDDDADGIASKDENVNGVGGLLDDDTDADGVPNFRDSDDDGDTIATLVEGSVDSDLDGTPDHLDDDDDDDGLRTALELGVDSDSDGKLNRLDSDDDGDGVPTLTEDLDGNGLYTDDTDLDGTPNYLDTDDDGDTIPSITEGTADKDLDGTPNYLDTDADGDTFLDSVELAVDSDLDGTADYLDTDSDNDTVLDSAELKLDSDGDGKSNRVDDDDDGDLIPTATEQGDILGDADGVPNYLDTDSDGDGWSDAYEWAQQTQADKDQDDDGNPDYVDTDSDADSILDTNELGTEAADVDTDLDGLENRIDADDDGDTIPTKLEDVELIDGDPTNDDTDNDGTVDYLDADDDNDTVPTKSEDPNNNGNPLDDDSDLDGTPNYRDTDDDNDGVLTANEAALGDSDSDGISNALDTDDDGDTIPTLEEGSLDPDLDGVPNHLDTDSDGDGWGDDHEYNTGVAKPDNDADGIDDYLDLDSDADEVPDADENGGKNKPLADTDTDDDGVIDRIDTDDDGDSILTKNEESELDNGNPQDDDHDNDGIADYLDADDDGDGVPTKTEDLDADGNPKDDDTDLDGVKNYLDVDDDNDGELSKSEDIDADGNPHDDDSDADGTPNYLDVDDDGDGIATAIETGEWSRNVDGDAFENHLDTDSDGDGWTDTHEWTVPAFTIDSDGDGDPDYVDTDSDNDTVLDADEGSSLTPLHSDDDTLEDRVDDDDDNDGIPTAEEETELVDGDPLNDDWDNDGLADFRDPDDDGDGVLTADEDLDGDGDPRDDDFDADLIPNWLDTDDDNDTVPTRDEDPDADGDPTNDDTDGDGDPNWLDIDDDGDTLTTVMEDDGSGVQSYDFDGDLVPNYLDADDDDDGVESQCELFYGSFHLVTDSDGDGVVDGQEWFNWLDPSGPDYLDKNGGATGTQCYNPWDRDSDGFINALDIDDDGDGIVTLDEGDADDDCPAPGVGVPVGDGIPNYLDYDSDGDLLLDGFATDGFGDADLDFIPDIVDCDDSGCGGDSDADGIFNCDEPDNCPVATPGYCATNPDVDGDGVLDGDEIGADAGCHDGDDTTFCVAHDTDGDGTPDVLDTDDDGDDVDTTYETGVCGGDVAWELGFDLTNNDWIFECADGSTEAVGEYQNTDADIGGAYPLLPDDVPDYLDTDDDGDTRDTREEGDADDDSDGVVNYLDPNDFDGPLADADLDGMTNEQEIGLGLDPYRADSDGDGISDDVEIGDPASPIDTDDDGTIDALDTDDDDDGLPTAVEGIGDADADGIPNYLDDDSDGDTKPDAAEGSEDVDCDGVRNYLDANDADGPCLADDSGDELITNQGCGCSSSGAAGSLWPSGSLWLAALALVGLRRRRG